MKKLLVLGFILVLVVASLAWAADIFEAGNMLYTGTHKLKAFVGTTNTTSGQPPIIISMGTATTSVATTTRQDITGASLTLPASLFDSQESIEFNVAGTITGTNGLKNFSMYVLNEPIATTTVLSFNSGAFVLNCALTASNTSTQIAVCGILVNGATTTVTVLNNLTKDLSSGGTVKIQILNASASDSVTVSTTMVRYHR